MPWRGLALVAVLVAIPCAVESRYVLGQVILALFLSTVASQWNLLFGYAGVFSLGQMAIFGFGGYATAMLCVYGGLALWVAIPLGALAAVALSLVVGVACLRLSGVYVALLTLAIAQALYLLIVSDTDCFTMVGSACRQLTGGAVGFARFGDLGTRAWLKSRWMVGDYAIASGLFGVTMLATYAVIHSPVGLAFRALKDNPGYAVARGVDRFQAQLLVFGLSAFFTGLAGGFYAGHFQAISPAILSLSQLLFIIAATVVGGVGSFWGPVVGTVVLMLADEAMREAGSFRTLGLGLIIAAAIVLMPTGLVGRIGDLGRWWRARRSIAAARTSPTPHPSSQVGPMYDTIILGAGSAGLRPRRPSQRRSRPEGPGAGSRPRRAAGLRHPLRLGDDVQHGERLGLPHGAAGRLPGAAHLLAARQDGGRLGGAQRHDLHAGPALGLRRLGGARLSQLVVGRRAAGVPHVGGQPAARQRPAARHRRPRCTSAIRPMSTAGSCCGSRPPRRPATG